jgi:hypothetical protein
MTTNDNKNNKVGDWDLDESDDDVQEEEDV